MVRVLFLSIIGTLFLSALITPAIFAGLQTFMSSVPWPYSRVFDRVAMLVLFGFLVFYRKEFQLAALVEVLREKAWGTRISLICFGFLCSVTVSALVIPFVVDGIHLDWREENLTPYYAWKILRFLPAALLISLIEESFFRFILMNFLKEKMNWLLAAMLSSVLYAGVHFITPDKSFVFQGWSLSVGFEYLAAIAGRVFHPSLFSALFGLFLVGMTLCLIMQRHRLIYLCIGLHAGWVIVVKALGYLTQTTEGFSFPPGAGRRYYLVSTYPGWGSIVGVAIVLLIALRLRDMKMAGAKHE